MGLHQPILNYSQARTAALGIVAALALFVATQRLCVPRFHFASRVDAYIPFLPSSWYAYVLFYPYVIWMAALASTKGFGNFKVAAALAFGVALCCFLAFPEQIPRPDGVAIDNAFLQRRLERMWQIDMPTHGLPSLHVTLTLLAARMVLDSRLGWVYGVFAMVICASTLTVKQHTVADVAGGVMLALLSAGIANQIVLRGAPRGKALRS